MEKIDHIAIVVTNINHAVNWYKDNRDCKVNYQDTSWAELQFENIKLALVLKQMETKGILSYSYLKN